MKILSTADLHWNQHNRFEECIRVHEWIVQEARHQKVDLVTISGDVYERASTPLEREGASEIVLALADVCPVVIAKGNHDAELDCQLLSKLKGKYPIIVEETAGVHFVAGAAVAAVAWPDRARMIAKMNAQQNADLERRLSSEDVNDAVHAALRDVLTGLGNQLQEHDGPRILMGHFMCDGAEMSNGQPLLGQPIRVGLSDLALARAHLILMGHIHKFQQWDCGGAPALYTGSPYRDDYGQPEEKSVTLSVFEGQRLVELTQIKTPARGMVHLEVDWDPEHYGASGVVPDGLTDIAPEELEACAGAEVRLRYNVAKEHQAAARAAVKLLADQLRARGAVDVKPEPVVKVERRVKVPEIAAAVTTPDKLEAFWASKGYEPADRRDPLLQKARKVEAACSSGVVSPPAVRLRKARIHKIGPIDDFELDLDAFPPEQKLIAFTGPNGTGKTLSLETMLPGILYRECPTNGRLQHRAKARDSFVEATVDTDRTWTIRHMFDCESGKGESVAFDVEGNPAFEGSGVNKFKAWAPLHVPTADLLFTTQFYAQRGAGPNPRLPWIDLGSADRISVILQAAGVAKYEAMTSMCRRNADETLGELDTLRTITLREQGLVGDLIVLEAALEAAKAEATTAEAELTKRREALAEAEAELRLIEEERKRSSEIAERRAELTTSLEAARRRLVDLEAQSKGAKALVARAETIRSAVKLAEGLRTKLATVEHEIRQAEAAREKAVALEERRSKLQASISSEEAKVTDLAARLTNNRREIERADETRSAVAEVEQLTARRAELVAERDRLRVELKAATDAIPKLTERCARVQARIAGAEKILENRERVQAAVQAVHDLNNNLTTAKASRDLASQQLEELRGKRLAGAGDRIAGLRGTLTTIASGGADHPADEAQKGLDSDDARTREAAAFPEQLKGAEAAYAEALERIRTLEAEREEQQRLSSQGPALDAAERDLAEAREELAGLKQEQTELSERSVKLGSQTAAAADVIEKTDARLEQLKPVAARIERLLQADARIAELQPQFEAATQQLAQLKAELEGLPAPLPIPEVPSAGGLRAELATVDQDAGQAEALVRAESFLEGQAPQEQAARDEMARLQADLDKLPVPTGRQPAHDHGAALRAVTEAEATAKAATAAVARAEQRIEQYHAGSARLKELLAEQKYLEAELGDWSRLAYDLGRDGLQSAEVDSAGPELTEIVNDLLHNCHGPRFTVSIETNRLKADGKEMTDECLSMVFDSVTGETKEVKQFSGGERDILGEAHSAALTILSCKRAGVQRPTLVRDESGAYLDVKGRLSYVAMLRRMVDIVGADKLLLVCHHNEVLVMVDACVDMTKAARITQPEPVEAAA